MKAEPGALLSHQRYPFGQAKIDFAPVSDEVTKRNFKRKSRPQLSNFERVRIVHSCLVEK